jgi:hypothetical protein
MWFVTDKSHYTVKYLFKSLQLTTLGKGSHSLRKKFKAKQRGIHCGKSSKGKIEGKNCF